jgi:hypothetical protein
MHAWWQALVELAPAGVRWSTDTDLLRDQSVPPADHAVVFETSATNGLYYSGGEGSIALIRKLQLAGGQDGEQNQNESNPTRKPPKRSTERGEGQAKLIAALTRHHKYAEGGSLNLEPVGNNKLAEAAGVSASTASAFFNDQFKGHTKYRALCQNAGKLAATLKLLNNEFAPYHLLGAASSDLAAPEEKDTDAE